MFESDSIADDLKGTAFHEAGHAFMHELFARPYTSVEIRECVTAQTGEKGNVYATDPVPTPEASPIVKVIYACLCFSGSVAEDVYKCPSSTAHGMGLANGGLDDLMTYKSMKLPTDCFNPLVDFTVKIIHENWKLIEPIANRLFEKRTLFPDEVKQLLSGSNLEEKQQSYLAELHQLILELNID